MNSDHLHQNSHRGKAKAGFLRKLAVALLMASTAFVGMAARAQADPYLLGPEDKLKISRLRLAGLRQRCP
ncbi:hypothetical protein LMIY3S_01497 [Labrys miyagiensis]